jgi:hypothetical protein
MKLFEGTTPVAVVVFDEVGEHDAVPQETVWGCEGELLRYVTNGSPFAVVAIDPSQTDDASCVVTGAPVLTPQLCARVVYGRVSATNKRTKHITACRNHFDLAIRFMLQRKYFISL